MRIERLSNGFIDIDIFDNDDELDIMQCINFAVESPCRAFILNSNSIIPEEVDEILALVEGKIIKRNRYNLVFEKGSGSDDSRL